MYYKEVSKNKKITYFIDEEAKTIVAKYYPDAYNLELRNNQVIKPFVEMYLGNKDAESFYIKDFYTGKAVCKDEDTFDLEKGKKIARYKAYVHYYEDRERIINKINNLYFMGIKDSSKEEIFLEEKLLKLNKDLEELMS